MSIRNRLDNRRRSVRIFVVAALIALASCGHAHADCKAEVDQAFSKLRGSKGFRLETTIVHEQQGTLHMTVDYQLPDRMHQRVSLGESPAKMETIAIGDKVWSNQGQGWSEVPANFAQVIAQQLKETVAEPSKSKIEYECLGEATFEGKPYLAYKATLPAAEETAKGQTEKSAGATNIQTLYIDKASGLPVRNVVTKGDGSNKRLFDGTFSTPDDITINAPG
jgi:outer membrane lipoprotein-sorting protein